MKISILKEALITRTPRVEMLESMFDVPTTEKLTVSLSGDVPVETRPWSIGLIVGPSGSGKTLLLNELFGPPDNLNWNSRSVIDDFDTNLSMESISRVCQSVGFNTIPSWLRPFSVLSNGERFRVETARRLLSSSDGVVRIDEFTSVVDRSVAAFASFAIAKYVRENNRRLVCASCHYDIIDWLQPDWLLEPGRECRFTWRSLQPRPPINVSVSRVKYETWKLFREFHYMSQDLNKAARCYGLYVERSPDRRHDMVNEPQRYDVHGSSLSDDSNLSTGGGVRIPSSGLRHGTGDSSILRHRETKEVSPFPSINWLSGSFIPAASATRTNSSTEKPEPIRPRNIYKNNDRNGDVQQHVSMDKLAESLVLPSQNRRIASMCGVLHRPHPKVSDICGTSRVVTLPDYQGLGLAIVLVDVIASAYKALGKRFHNYPNHPAYIRSHQRNKNWLQIKQAGDYSPRSGTTSTVGGFGGKRCAVFMYIGPAMNREQAEHLIYPEGRPSNDD